MRPVLLRPPLEFLPSVNALIGLPLYSAERSTITNWRWPGVVGLYFFNAIAVSPYSPVVTSMRWPSSRVTIARFTSDWEPNWPRKTLVLPLRTSVFTLFTLTSNSFFDGFLDLRLGGLSRNLEHDLVMLRGHRRFFGHDRRYDDVVMAR